jgi:thiol-disulfide isomerase/thioredoxin
MGLTEAALKRVLALLFSIAIALTTAAAQTPAIISDVRAALKANDFATAEKTLSTYRAAHGITPDFLEALSWMGRGALAAKNLDAAETYARETHQLSTSMLKTRALDHEPRLPTALGAAIEVLGQVGAARGARTEAVSYLRNELDTYRGTSIEKRIQKNVNLVSLEGQPAPSIDISEYLGPKPPPIAALKGKVVLLFFWAHWCGDCKQQAPILAELASKYGSQGLVVFAPTQRFGYVAGGKQATPDEELRYIDQVRQQYYPVLAGQPVPVTEANHLRYGVSTTPTLVLLDRQGIVRLYNPGRLTLEQLEPRVRALVQVS